MKDPVDMKALIPRFVEESIWVRPFGRLVYLEPQFMAISDEEVRTLTRGLVKILMRKRNEPLQRPPRGSQKEGTFRTFKISRSKEIREIAGKKLLNLSSNDYLGLQAMPERGASSSRLPGSAFSASFEAFRQRPRLSRV